MNSKFESLLDLYGADLNSWPDQTAAQKAREAAMRDPEFRSRLDAAKRIDASFGALANALDKSPSIEAGLAAMQSSMLTQIEAQAQRRRAFSSRTLMRLAASVVIACGLGIGVGQIVPDQTLVQADAHDQLLLGTSDGSTHNGDR
ncbi:hypothetical protein [Hoeflea sp. TYP-13]|uniref:hypothetical protein n=1 Tax=Hoeflea sp. TYP-13 TaxID=3230023 RepID=UPI0034C63C4C